MNRVRYRAAAAAAALSMCFLFSVTAFGASSENAESYYYIYGDEDVAETETSADSAISTALADSTSATASTDSAGETAEQTSRGADAPDAGITAEDVRYDAEANRQFITIEDRDGNLFYIIIDYDVPVNGEEEQYKTYFLNAVDTSDLNALTLTDTEWDEEDAVEEEAVPVCTCETQCRVGEVDTSCEVCLISYTSCTGEPVEVTEDEAEETPSGGGNYKALIAVIIIFAGIGVFLYVRLGRGNTGAENGTEEDDYEYDGYDDGDFPDGGADPIEEGYEPGPDGGGSVREEPARERDATVPEWHLRTENCVTYVDLDDGEEYLDDEEDL